MALRFDKLGLKPNDFVRIVDFSKFGSPAKNADGVVIPGSWRYNATVNGERVSFKAPFPSLPGHNGAKLQYVVGTFADGNTNDWFELYDTVTTAADGVAKVAAQTALAGVNW